MIDGTKPLVLMMTPFTLLLSGTIVLIMSFKAEKKFIIYLIITWIVTFAIEAAGVKTGMIFGQYSYGSTLGLKLLDVPVIIGLNWVILVIGGAIFVRDVLKVECPFIGAFFAGLVTTYVDLFIEPIAIRFDYWTWQTYMPGWRNYFAWWLITALFTLVFYALKIKPKSRIIIHYVLIQLVFFIVLYLSIV